MNDSLTDRGGPGLTGGGGGANLAEMIVVTHLSFFKLLFNNICLLFNITYVSVYV